MKAKPGFIRDQVRNGDRFSEPFPSFSREGWLTAGRPV
jgi:hypothetical protein